MDAKETFHPEEMYPPRESHEARLKHPPPQETNVASPTHNFKCQIDRM